VELTGYQAKTGERLWWVRGVTYAPASSPLVAGDSVYTMEPVPESGGAPPFSGMLAQYDKNKDGKIQLSELTGDGINDKIYQRIFKSVDKNSGNNDGEVTAEEWEHAFGADQSLGGLVRIRLGGKGDVSKSSVGWRHTKGLPYIIAPIVYQNLLYSVRNGGIVSVFDPESGKVLREERLKNAIGDYYSQPVAGDGKVYLTNKEGKISVLRAGSDWTLLSSGDLDEQVIATPAIANGKIYMRTEGSLYCFAANAPKLTDPKAE
jgi:outer membrane protein assembly factor BamB